MSCFDFDSLPINTERIYIMKKDKSGCEIYIPVISRDDGAIASAKKHLLEFLNNQPEPELKMA